MVTHAADDPALFLEEFAARIHPADEFASALYASDVQSKVDPRVVRGVFTSRDDLSDHGDLLARFVALPRPRMFGYGEQNARLSYLPALRAGGVELAEIPFSGHWPMYSNAVAMWGALEGFFDLL